MQRHLIRQKHPGLLAGLPPRSNVADNMTFNIPLSACALLEAAFNTSTQPWTFDQKTAVAGWGTWQHCIVNRTWNAGYKPNGAVTDNAGCAVGIPPAILY